MLSLRWILISISLRYDVLLICFTVYGPAKLYFTVIEKILPVTMFSSIRSCSQDGSSPVRFQSEGCQD